MADDLAVEGAVLDAGHQPMAGVLVRVFDQDLPSLHSDQFLAEATTDAEGRYRAIFSAEQYRANEWAGPDLYIEARAPDGTLLGRSDTQFNAQLPARIDLEVQRPTDARLSEFETLTARMLPLLGGLAVHQLTREDVAFLARELSSEERLLAWLVGAAQLALRTGLPAEAFYGWARADPPLPPDWEHLPTSPDALDQVLQAILAGLIAAPDQQLQLALLAAIEHAIIPSWVRDQVDEIVRELKRSALSRHVALGRLLDAVTGDPLVETDARVLDLEAGPEPQELDLVTTDRQGLFSIAFGTAEPDGARKLRITVLGADGTDRWSMDLVARATQSDVVELRVPPLPAHEPESHTLDGLRTQLQLTIPPELASFLADRQVRSLSDIRRAGGLQHVDGLPVPPEDPAVRTLDAQADLSRLSADVQTNAALIGRGFSSLASIAETPLPAFVTAAHDVLGDAGAARLQLGARAHTAFVRNLLTAQAVGNANGVGPANTLIPQQCECRDCEAAVSPAAYLADLIGYATKHLMRPGGGVDIRYLEQTFCQPFGQLPTDCRAVDVTARQARLCVEVLRQYLAAHPPDAAAAAALDQATRAYLLVAYLELLARLGTSYEEVRVARTASDQDRHALADRLGIDLTVPRPDPATSPGDELDHLFLDPDPKVTGPKALSEAALERIFGLVDTTRDPLSQGVKIGDDTAPVQLARWNLDGAVWLRNTDPDGLVYVHFKNFITNVLISEVEVYRDSARTSLVASGSGSTPSGDRTVKLVEKDWSGLRGSVRISGFDADNSAISIGVIPRVLCWKLKHLRTQWRAEDFPLDVFTEGYRPEADRRPIIEPDVIGPDDFRQPDAGQAPFALWLKRRNWVDQQLRGLGLLTTTVVVGGTSVTVPDIDTILAQMYQPLSYDGTSVQPWQSSTPVSAFDGLAQTLREGSADEVLAARTRIAADLALEVDALQLIIDVQSKARAWRADPNSDAVQPGEWSVLFSVLVQAQKTRLFAAWIAEEKAAPIVLGPGEFWRAQREPQPGEWPPTRAVNTPFIDPEVVKGADLPEPTVGQAAIDRWAARRAALATAARELAVERTTNGFDAMLRRALGNPNPGDPLQDDLATLRTDLASVDNAVAEAARQKIALDLHLSIEQFNRVVTLRDRSAPTSANPPTASDWADLYALLTTAHKIKHLYPQWIAEEDAAGLSTEYWRALKARLPQGRATGEARAVWQQALQVRSQPAIVDPDLVLVQAFNGLTSEPAFTLWQTRRDWEDAQIATFAAATTLAGLDSSIQAAIGVPATELVALGQTVQQGTSIQARLVQIGLSTPALAYLLQVRELLSGGQPVTSDEWQATASILVQVAKSRLSQQWRDEERAAGVFLSPDLFVVPDLAAQLAAAPDATTTWRTPANARATWLSMLQSRIDQEQSVLLGHADSVSAVEDDALPRLRDALVLAAGVGADLDSKAGWVTDRLLIDAKMDGCQQTTRIAQAIETLQQLLFQVRSGQSGTLQTLGLSLAAEHFDEEWRWIGSYATWRAATFVLMYPENIAVGSLRRRQTPAFRTLVAALRGARQLTGEQACRLAADYARQYEDVARLTPGASCQAAVVQRTGTACAPGTMQRQWMVLLFGRGGLSGRAYWSTFDPADHSGYAQSYWDAIPGLDAVDRILGAVPYERSASERHVYLFIRTPDHKLQFLKFDLESAEWGDPIDLALPAGDPSTIEVVVNQTNDRPYPPYVAMHAQGNFYYRPLNQEGTGWQDGDWPRFQLDAKALNLAGVSQLVGAVRYTLWVRRSGQLEQRYTSGYWSSTSLDPKRVDAEYVGAVLWGLAKNSLDNHLVERRKDGAVVEAFSSSQSIGDGFPLRGLQALAPNWGVTDIATFTYQRQNPPSTGKVLGKKPISLRPEADGVYLRVDQLDDVLRTTSRPQISRYCIAPRLVPNVAGQFVIPARLQGAELDVRRQAVALIMSALGDSATNRTYAEEAYFFVPMMLADALRQSGEYLAALDYCRTVLDYTLPPDKQKVYYGLVQEESLPDTYQRSADWLLDPLDPHAIATTRRLSYTRFTLRTIVQTLLDFADDEFTRDTSETVPRARGLYLEALAVLDSPALKQQLGACAALIGQIQIELGPGPAPSAKGAVAKAALLNRLSAITDVSLLSELAPQLQQTMASAAPLDERLARAQAQLEATQTRLPPLPSVAGRLELGAAVVARASAGVLADVDVENAAAAAAQLAGAQFDARVRIDTGVDASALSDGHVSLAWLRSDTVRTVLSPQQMTLSPDLTPTTPDGGSWLIGRLRPIDVMVEGIGGVIGTPHLPPPPGPPYPPKPVVAPSLAFCVPPNPLLGALRLHAELNLRKLRTCRNIAGMQRELDPYAAPTDTTTGLPTIGPGGQLQLADTATLRPTVYRFAVLLLRAKELVATAQQMEASLLAALEKRDAEAYNLLRARQDLELAQAEVQLEALRVKQANDGVTLASLQQQRAQIQADHWQNLLDQGLLELERGAIETLGEAAILQATAADLNFAVAAIYGATVAAGALAGGVAGAATGGPAGAAVGAIVGALGQQSAVVAGLNALSAGYMGLAQKRSTRAQIQLTLANFERRTQDWQLAESLAKQDVAIGAQQVTIANDAVDIARQEKEIADTRNRQARDTVNFLATKFTSADLYDWMAGILARVYQSFLKQATAVSLVAENQLAFERQETPVNYILSDYWQAPDQSTVIGTPGGPSNARYGLTGSARLLQDLARLEQYAFDTTTRKLQLSKTISLAQVAPTEFQQFRETGVMRFSTPSGWFDADFPGQYLRLIKRVRTSVIALIPPAQGIRATLACGGVSRVVIGPDVFQTVRVRRDPELVALSSPMNASGVFELEPQPDLLLPFEGRGVDNVWEFRMPKAANQLDYTAIADVLMTIDYTALHSDDYRQQVLQSLGQNLSADRPFSVRNQLADQWYDLHNPDRTSTPMVVQFRTTREDFPPNLDAIKIQQLLLYFARRSGSSFEVPVAHLRFTEDGSPGAVGGAATSSDGIISTRRGNAGSWLPFIGKSPFGIWELALPDSAEMRARFADDDIEEVLFVVTFTATTPAWPV